MSHILHAVLPLRCGNISLLQQTPSSPHKPLPPHSETLAMVQVYFFPSGASSLSDHPWWFALLAVAGLVTSFTSTLMFTALGSFYTRISDPDMGGSYLTLLNTIANMGEQPAS